MIKTILAYSRHVKGNYKHDVHLIYKSTLVFKSALKALEAHRRTFLSAEA